MQERVRELDMAGLVAGKMHVGSRRWLVNFGILLIPCKPNTFLLNIGMRSYQREKAGSVVAAGFVGCKPRPWSTVL